MGFATWIVQHHLPIPLNERGIVSGRSTETISSENRSRAQRCAPANERHGNATTLVTSGLPRNLDTAYAWAEGTTLQIVVDDRLTALDYGGFAGRSRDWVNPQLKHFIDEPIPGGESLSDMASRYRSFLDDKWLKYSGLDVILLGHACTQTVLMHLCMGLELLEALQIEAEAKRTIAELRARGHSRQAAVDASYANSPIRGPFAWPPTGRSEVLGRASQQPLLGTYSTFDDVAAD